ncbi:MAG: putative Ig domain-containing protein [bacterium]
MYKNWNGWGQLDSQPATSELNTYYWLKMAAFNNGLKAKYWQDLNPEPSGWVLNKSHDGIATGKIALSGWSTATRWDDVKVRKYIDPEPMTSLGTEESQGPAGLNIITILLPGGTVGTVYSRTVSATGGTPPYTWSISAGSLPGGLSLNSSTGVISGTPTTAGTSNFTVQVQDSSSPVQTDDQALSITINPATLTITTTSLPSGTVGTAYYQTVSATGGTTPYTWSILSGSLPPGLSLTSGTPNATISGTPTTAGTYNFTVRVTDAASQTNDQPLSIIINPAGLNITTTSLPGGRVGTTYSQTVSATGGTTPYTWSILSGSLPPGLSLTSGTPNATIFGTPTTAGTYNFTVRVTDAASQTDDQPLSITINPAGGIPIEVITSSSTSADSEFDVEIQVGDAGHPVSNLFGLSFCLNYSPAGNVTEVVSVDTEPGFLGNDQTHHDEANTTTGTIRIGVSRKRPASGVSGSGVVARIRLRASAYAAGQTVTFSLSDVDARDPNGGVISLNPVSDSVTITDLVVWPGDTDNNGVVNELDIFPVANYWLSTGAARSDNGFTWGAQTATPWTLAEATYADANGDGEVNEKEVVVIGVHWGRTRGGGSPAPGREILSAEINHARNLEAYRAMYRLLEDSPKSEAVTRMKDLLASLIDLGLRGQITERTGLAQNYPNPVNPETFIPFTLDSKSEVKILIYDLAGQLVRTLDMGERESGVYFTQKEAAYWDGKDEAGREVASGVYFCQLQAGDKIFTKRMIVVK